MEGGRQSYRWYFDEGEGEGGAEEDNHGDSLCLVHLQILIITSA